MTNNRNNLPDTNDQTEVSIWEQPEFPHKTNKIQFTPQDLKNALREYESTTKPIAKILKDRGIKAHTFFKLVGVYPEIGQYYLSAQKSKAHQYGSACMELWEQLPEDPAFYQVDRDGNKSLSTAGVRYLEVKSTMMLKQAQIHESGSYIPVSKQETLNKNLSIGVNLSGKIPDDFDLSTAQPEDLINLIRHR